METMRANLRLPTISLNKIDKQCSGMDEPPSPDSGFSSDESTYLFSNPCIRQKSLRSALRRLPSDSQKRVRFGGAVVVQFESTHGDDDPPPPSSYSPTNRVALTLPNFSFRTESEYWKRARDGGVCVSAIKLCGSSLLIQLAVHNRAFNKEVFVRWTTNSWESNSDQPAVYSHTTNSEIDIFTVSLSIKEENVEFCACYRVDGTEFWDNNENKNYHIRFRL